MPLTLNHLARYFMLVPTVAAALLLSLFAGLLTPSGAWAGSAKVYSLEGQKFDTSIKLADQTLLLNGAGLRGVLWYKGFVAGLYLPAVSKDNVQVVAMPGAKRVRIKVMVDASSHELTKSLQGRIEDHEPESLRTQVADRLITLAKQLDSLGNLHVGDALDLDFVPNKGIYLRLNDKQVGQPVAGEDLYGAVLRIFVGDFPVDKRMKQGMMRGGV